MSPANSSPSPRVSLRHRLEHWAGASLINAVLLLPYEKRVPFMGWVFQRVLGPLGFNTRTKANLDYVCPELDAPTRKALCAQVADNFGRSLIELQSGAEFAARVKDTPVSGPGLAALHAAHAQGKPVILVSGHFGNYDAWRAKLISMGFRVGGLYKPMSNSLTNASYIQKIESIGKPLFPRGNAGMANMVRFLRKGGMLGILGDLYVSDGELINFMGRPARTATSAAKLALKYDALLVPLYATRTPNGLGFRIEVEAPIPHSDPIQMTEALNASMEQRVRAHMGQWFWVHRRWKHNTND